jgi:succinyl-CoA synthetase beta subunit
VHKIDVGGVVLDISSDAEARKACQTIHENVARLKPGAQVSGLMVSKQVQKGEEVILGVKRDPSFGAVIMFGLGGTFVELYRDVSFRVAPLNGQISMEMIQEIKAYGLLDGARGRPPKDKGALIEAIQRLSQLAVDCPQIRELDINPLIVLDEGQGCFVADAKIMI